MKALREAATEARKSRAVSHLRSFPEVVFHPNKLFQVGHLHRRRTPQVPLKPRQCLSRFPDLAWTALNLLKNELLGQDRTVSVRGVRAGLRTPPGNALENILISGTKRKRKRLTFRCWIQVIYAVAFVSYFPSAFFPPVSDGTFNKESGGFSLYRIVSTFFFFRSSGSGRDVV